MSSASFSTRAEPSAQVCKRLPSTSVFEAQGAPFDGVLVHPECLAAKGLELKVCKIDLSLLTATRAYEVKKLNEVITREGSARLVLEDELDEARAWYRSPAVWGSVGLVVGVAAGVGAAALIAR